ncbi:MAG TPA: DUF1549 domain-containing protein, partial [Gemmataceae bacterium]|nr:DUF1549 domain-containing protein [Gemmataceae bacterium]
MRTALILGACTIALPAVAADPLPPAADRKVDFTRDVQPIFAKHCYSCHGETKQKAGLRLDLRPDARLPKILKAGNSAESRLIQLVAGTDPETAMPLGGPPLAREKVAVLRSWIDQGARWPAPEGDQWALRPLTSLPVPTATRADWCRNPIDHFVLVKLTEKGLSPSPPADRRSLVRRLTYNLHGLPPTPEEIDAFVKDPAANAYEKLVDRLLDSPRYGERWARHWMDIAHFAETHGHDQDAVRENAWPYRDYLIRSLNADKPYGRFVQEQIAGDVLFPEDPSAVVALGFLAAGPWDESSQKDIRDDTVDKKAAQYIDRDDMITTVFTAVASTSIHCARCHDHKFDPIPQAEYYGLQAVFAGVDRANRAYDRDPAVTKARRDLRQRQAEVAAGQFDPAAEQAAVAAWEKDAAARLSRWKPLGLTVTAKEAKVEPKPDGSYLFTGPTPQRDTYTLIGTAPEPITALRLETLSDASLPKGGPGRQDNGNFHLCEIRVRTGAGTGMPVRIVSAAADFNQTGWTAAQAIDGDPNTAWAIHPAVGKLHEAVFVLKDPIPKGARFVVELEQSYGDAHIIGRARLGGTSDANPALSASPLPADVDAALAVPADKRTDAQWKVLTRHVLTGRIAGQFAALPKPEHVYAATTEFDPLGNFKPPRGPRPVHMLRRGEVTKAGAEAKPGALSCVPGPVPFAVTDPTEEGQRRAALARWLTDRENGLVWRSIVNRVWHYHVGRGIVNTPNDFGRMGATATHPELLDWLAVWFRDGGGS